VFLHLVGSAGHETSTHYFSSSGGTSTYLTKSAPGHVMPTLCLHQVDFAGHVVHSGATGA
jgi:hypothetical protein